MGVFKIGEAVCNNCVHWRCHSERKFRGNPPREVYTTSNCDKCSLTNRNTLSSNACGMFRHIGGVLRVNSQGAVNMRILFRKRKTLIYTSGGCRDIDDRADPRFRKGT